MNKYSVEGTFGASLKSTRINIGNGNSGNAPGVSGSYIKAVYGG